MLPSAWSGWSSGRGSAGDPQVQATIAAPEQIRQLVEHDFEDYYSSAPAGSFAAQVATNNAWVSALALALGVLMLPVVWILWQNALNVGIAGGLMAANGRLDLFFGLILPHGLLELTCVFVAAGAGLRLGWSWIDPGAAPARGRWPRRARRPARWRLGLAATLFVSGVVEAFVTPSGLPTWARIGIGALLWLAFLTYVVVLGGRAVRAGEMGDLRGSGATDIGADGRLTSEPAGGLEREIAVGQLRGERGRRRVDHLDAAAAEQLGEPPALRPSAFRGRGVVHGLGVAPGVGHLDRPRVGDRGDDHLVPVGQRGEHRQQPLLDRRGVQRGEQHDQAAPRGATEHRAHHAGVVGLDQRRIQRRHRRHQGGQQPVAATPSTRARTARS